MNWIAVCTVLCAGSSPANAWETRTHQQITEAAWQFIKGKAKGDPAFGAPDDYPTQQDCARTVSFFQGLHALPCAATKSCYVFDKANLLGQVPQARALALYQAGAPNYEVIFPNGHSAPKPNATINGKDVYVPGQGVLATSPQGDDLLHVTWSSGDPTLDYTGSVLGYFAGAADYLNDTYALTRNEVAREKLRNLLESETRFAITWAGLACLAASATIVGATLCGALAGLGYYGAEELVEEVFGYIPESYPTSSIAGNTLSAFWHFHPIAPHLPSATSYFDDTDGFQWSNGRRSDAYDLKFTAIRWVFSFIDVGISPTFSHAPVDQYHVSGDGHAPFYDLFGDQGAASYWRSRTVTEAIFMPSDNMLRANWDNWIRLHGRAGAGVHDLTFLGNALHAMQDASSAVHFASTLLDNHQEYEQHVEGFFDSVPDGLWKHPVWNGSRFVVMKWAGAAGRKNLEGISRILKDVVHRTITRKLALDTHRTIADRNDIPVRDIALELTKATGDQHLADAQPSRGDQQIHLPYHSIAGREDFTAAARVGIRHAIAGTVALLVQASRTDVVWSSLGEGKYFSGTFDYRDIDGDGVPSHKDACPVTGKVMEGTQLLYDVGDDGCPDPETGVAPFFNRSDCIGQALNSANEQYAAGSIDGETAVDNVFVDTALCDVDAHGEATATLEDRVDARRQVWTLVKNFLATGDSLAYRKEEACIRSAYPGLFPGTPATAAQLCTCQLDTDGDGVSECDDECPATPRGVSVDAVGCSAGMGG